MPMSADHAALIAAENVFVLEVEDFTCGVLVLLAESDQVMIENVALLPSAQGKGYGRLLMDFAEQFARERGYAELRLYTNVKMVENIEIYKHLGYVETGRAGQDGYARVFMSKLLEP